jgi:hypothetical protein
VKPIAVNSLFRRMSSLFGRHKFAVPAQQGILAQDTEIAELIDVSGRHEARRTRKFPAIFPVTREFEDCGRSGLRGSLDMICIPETPHWSGCRSTGIKSAQRCTLRVISALTRQAVWARREERYCISYAFRTGRADHTNVTMVPIMARTAADSATTAGHPAWFQAAPAR